MRQFYGVPTHFFPYWGFGWVQPLPLSAMYALYAMIGGAALCLMLGIAARPAAALAALAFGYAHFCDKANYLNHYYLITLLLGLLACLPVDREFSLRVFRRPSERRGQVRAWVLYLLRFQIGVVYVFGGLAKLNSDWLMHAEPLRIWLSANAELPILGRILNEPWAGILFQLVRRAVRLVRRAALALSSDARARVRGSAAISRAHGAACFASACSPG